MAHIQVNAFVGKDEMEITLDNYQWKSLTVDGQNIEPNGSGGFSKKVKFTKGEIVPFTATVEHVEILNPPVNDALNGGDYDRYCLTINYAYTSADKTEVELTGNLAFKNGYLHHAPKEYTFSQGKLTGVFQSVG